MKIKCINGFYKFYPENPVDLTRFQLMTGYSLVEFEDGYTFQELADFNNYTLYGEYSKTVCYNPSEVFRQNGLSFNLETMSIVSRATINKNLVLYKRYKGIYQYVGLPQAYGKFGAYVLTGFSGYYDVDYKVFTLEVIYTSDVIDKTQNTKVFEASCSLDNVSVEGNVIPEVKILSAGKSLSNGLLIVNGADKIYIAIPIDSIKSFIDNVSNLIDTLSSGILPSNSGGQITSGTFTSDLAAIKSALTTLKGALQ